MTPEYNLILILLIAALNAYTAWQTQQSKRTIDLLEKNTNSIKDALVAATAKASLREGMDAGIAQVHAENKTSDEPVKVEIVKIPTLPKT